jgi:hypothetical protein
MGRLARRPPFLLLLVVALIGAVCAAPGAAQAKKKKPTCARRGAHTLLATDRSIVFRKGSTAYGCLYKKGRPRKLGDTDECQGTFQASGFRLSGRYVGYLSATCDLDTGDVFVRVLDLRSGHIKYSAPGATGVPDVDDSTDVTAFEMKPDGSAVWIGEFDQGTNGVTGPGDERQVRKVEPGSPDSVIVDSGLDIVRGSLALSENTFYWTKGSTPSSSTLH